MVEVKRGRVGSGRVLGLNLAGLFWHGLFVALVGVFRCSLESAFDYRYQAALV